MALPQAATNPRAARQATRDQQQDQAIARLAKDKARLTNLARATLRLGQFQDEVQARAEGWQMAARDIGSAYATAAKRHTDALAKQDKIEALKIQLMFSVLTVATVGSLSWVSSGLGLGDKYPERRKLIEAVEDAAQAGVDKTYGAMGPLIQSSQGQSVSIDPLVFQNERENAVSEAKIKVLEHFGRIKREWAAAPLEKWDGYTEARQVAEHGAWLRRAATLAGKDSLPSIGTMADELERGIWAAWLPGLKSTRSVAGHSGYSGKVDLYASVGGEIEDRLEELGILKAAGVEIHWYQRAETEGKGLIAWAQGYKVKDFLSLK
jgi:hypothetical protein